MWGEDSGSSVDRKAQASAVGGWVLVDAAAGNDELSRVCEADDECSGGMQGWGAEKRARYAIAVIRR